VFWILGCWQPDAYTPPAPAEVTAADIAAGLPAGSPNEAGRPDGGAGSAEAPDEGSTVPADATASEPSTEAAEAPAKGNEAENGTAKSDFDDAPVQPWTGHTVGTPLSLVDDLGRAIAVIGLPGTKVTVLTEGSLRMKVRCDGCDPQVEGYIQRDKVQR
jgi:hypothetical protein